MLASPAEASPATERNRMAADDFRKNRQLETRRQYRGNIEVETGQAKERHKLDDVQYKSNYQGSRLETTEPTLYDANHGEARS